MPAFVQVSEDQNSAVLWPKKPIVLKFVNGRWRGWHDCDLCICRPDHPESPELRRRGVPVCSDRVLPCGSPRTQRDDRRHGHFVEIE
jgi:hypothetical protein